MKEIVVISGKGGTGKTSLTASFACLGGKNVTVADCDVDAADMHLLMQPDFDESNDFFSGELAVISRDQCSLCGKCAEVCRFDAITVTDRESRVDPLACEGCGYCARVCPEDAIRNETQLAGRWYVSKIRTGSRMVHARLGIGADNSGKLVARVKNESRRIAKESGLDLILIDGSPGIGCPVISSLSGGDFVVLLTEPSVSGLHDLKRVYELVKKFNIPAGCIINKFDLNMEVSGHIENFLEEEGIFQLGRLPYDELFTESMTYGKTIVEYTDSELSGMVSASWNQILNVL
jgi:MinD superfamily P-loop ATPase